MALTRQAAAALPLQLLNPYAAVREPISYVTTGKHDEAWNGYGIDVATTSANPSAVYWDGYFSDGSNAVVNVTEIGTWRLYSAAGCNEANYVLTQYHVQMKHVYPDGAVAQIEYWHLDTPSVSLGQNLNSGAYVGIESNAPGYNLYYCTGKLASQGRHLHVQVYASWGKPTCYVSTNDCYSTTPNRWPTGTWEWTH